MRLTLKGIRLVDPAGERPDASITIEDERIVAAGVPPSDQGLVVDAEGLVVLPGFVDVHTHGGGGFSLQTTDAGEIGAYARWAPSTGTTAFLVAVVGVPGEPPEAQLRTAAAACAAGGPGAEPLGIHLEGPYINPGRRGAHAPAWLRTPQTEETERLLQLARGWLRIVTLAPELPGAENFVRRLVAAGVRPSIGHTDASYELARTAIGWGVVHATHCFNAMPPLLHRSPGPIAAIVEAPGVLAELIGDGHHVLPPTMRVLVRAVGPERIVIVTDALACAGLVEGSYTFGGQQLHLEGGVARLSDGTISGSILTLDRALRNVVEWLDVSLADAARMLSFNPAVAAGIAEHKGRLLPNFDADLALFDARLELVATICRGRLAYATDERRALLAPLAAVA